MRQLIGILLFAIGISLSTGSCKKDRFNTSFDARLSTSTDSIKFDTVFTTVGSITQSFKIFNENDEQLRLSTIKLMGGTASAFKININGQAVTQWNDIDIAANDSIYVFVTAFIDPTNQQAPFLLQDSILIQYNGNNRFVQLEAYGQNAHYLHEVVIQGQQNWTNDLPYVITGGLRIDTTAHLSIEAGCRIYLHANAPWIVDGQLTVNGRYPDPVTFTGDRLDTYYRDLPGSWPGMLFRGLSHDNTLTFTNIRNAVQGLVVTDPSINNAPKLTLHQCIIANASDAGLLAIQTRVSADNCLVSNCGKSLIWQGGGEADFTHCTVAAYSNSFQLHRNPALSLSNSRVVSGSLQSFDLSAVFRNCIFWGSEGLIDDEVILQRDGNTAYDVTLDHCLYRATSDPVLATLLAPIRNEDPRFDSIDVSNQYYDFHRTQDPFAPGIDQGVATPIPTDLDDAPRNVNGPDLGCYEKQ